jgi:hypothetical protein
MEHYKSWANLNRQLNEYLCDQLKERLSYFLTRYHKVHDSYGRAAILLDGQELVCFSWIEMYHQENDIALLYKEDKGNSYDELSERMKPKWDEDGTYYEMDFLKAVLQFRSMAIQEALQSDNYIIKILAILDRRIGKRTLKRIADDKEYEKYPGWVQRFYILRLMVSNLK